MISIIAALTKDRVIGKNNELVWHISEDLKKFKEITKGKTIIMGRKTYESIGRPLPNRRNIVVSNTMKAVVGVEVCDTLKGAVELGEEKEKELVIIGGASIYEQALTFVDRMYLSWIKGEYEGDAYFPEFSTENWKVVEEKEYEEFIFKVYDRR